MEGLVGVSDTEPRVAGPRREVEGPMPTVSDEPTRIGALTAEPPPEWRLLALRQA